MLHLPTSDATKAATANNDQLQGWVIHRVTFLHRIQHTCSNSSRTNSHHRPESAHKRSGITNMLSVSTIQLAAALQPVCIAYAVV